jgi:hypothetical protein
MTPIYQKFTVFTFKIVTKNVDVVYVVYVAIVYVVIVVVVYVVIVVV